MTFKAAESNNESLRLWVVRLQEQANRLQARNLYVAEHPPLPDDALRTAKSRLMIISPWIKRKVVDQAFIRKLEQLLSKEVRVYIGYGN